MSPDIKKISPDFERLLTSKERLIGACLNVYPDSQEVLGRTPEDLLALEARDAERRGKKRYLLKEQVDEVLSCLSEVEHRVVILRFGLDDGSRRTQAQAGLEIGGLSRWQVGRIERRARDKLRHSSKKPL